MVGFNTTLQPSFPVINTTSTYAATKDYFLNLPNAVGQGDIASMIIAVLLFFVLIFVVNKLTTLLLELLKRTLLLIIVILVMVDFIPRYLAVLQSEGAGFGTILIGVGALLISGTGLFIASRSLFRSAKKHIEDMKFRKEHWGKTDYAQKLKGMDVTNSRIEHEEAHTENVKDMFSKESLKSDKSLITVLIYLIVAQFGVFSSPTLSAPNEKVGIMLFLIFAVGIFFFVKKTYKDQKVGFTYLAATFIVGIVFSFFLGSVWGNASIMELFSLNFFKSDSLIALISGMSVSMFAGSKG
ncbi:MAG: hypothetical protein KKF44_10935 [Nanoarchaeota archaeon]|nr:hypothetical protein [Nanoarchaeota archaeon]